MNKIESFQVVGLHGYKNYILKFKDNSLILIGENGTGKTTILRLFYYMVTGQWNLLSKYSFDSISVRINKKTIKIDRSEIEIKLNINDSKFLRRIPPSARRRITDAYENYSNSEISLSELEYLCDLYDIPFKYILRELEGNELNLLDEKPINEKLDQIRKQIGKTQVLYLPTYRRIEQELSSIFKGVDEDELRNRRHFLRKRRTSNYTELIEFGMKDVQNSIESTLDSLKEFARESLNSLTLGYLGDVVDQKYATVDVQKIKKASHETIINVLDRIEKKILSDSSKSHLFQTIETVKKDEEISVHARVICHYFIKLLNFQEKLEHMEKNIRHFCEVCNNYMEDKKFVYTSSSFSFEIEPKVKNNENQIKLEQLSSGEKQIVSLFSHLYLMNDNRYFVLIDEPELSLSVPWQRQFLVDIRNGNLCDGLIAVTHSPFIYDNNLEDYAHGLGEFIN